jgi:hypothetical protein
MGGMHTTLWRKQARNRYAQRTVSPPVGSNLRSSILPSNVFNGTAARDSASDGDDVFGEAVADLVVAGGMLALIVTAFVVIGHRIGGPAATRGLWFTLAPLLFVPLAILVALLVVPREVVRGRATGWLLRTMLAVVGCVAFGGTLLLLNLPALLH